MDAFIKIIDKYINGLDEKNSKYIENNVSNNEYINNKK